MNAKDAHKTFLNTSDKIEVSIAFRMAELRYLTASAALSEQLAKQYVNFDHLAIGIGLSFLFLVTYYACNLHKLNKIFIPDSVYLCIFSGIMWHYINDE